MTPQTSPRNRPLHPPTAPRAAGPPPVPPRFPPADPAPPSPPGDTARTAALWLGGTGVFLLTVAAAVLVAIRWDDIAAWTKIAGLLIANGSVLVAGTRLRATLPATARALDHLGALLVPLSVAAVAIQVALPWPWALLAVGLLGGFAAWALDSGDAPVLEFVALAAAIPVATGLAAIVHVPAAIVLAGAGLLAAAARPRVGSPRWFGAVGWSSLAAASAYLVALDDPVIRTSRILSDLGLGSAGVWWAHLAAGALATAALVILATTDEDEALGLVAIVAALSSVVAAVAQLGRGAGDEFNSLVVALAVVVAAEILAFGFSRHRPWNRLLPGLAGLGEVGLAVTTVALLPVAYGIVQADIETSPSLIASGGLIAIGWFLADYRRRVRDCQSFAMALVMGGGWIPGTVGLAVTGLITAATLGASLPTVAWVAVGLGIAAVSSGRAGGHGTAVLLGWVAVSATSGGMVSVTVAGLVALTLAWAAALRYTSGPAPAGSYGLLVMGLLSWAAGAAELGISVLDEPAFAWVAWVIGAAVITVIVERAATDPVRNGAGLLGRGLMLAGFVPTVLGTPIDAQLPALLLLSGFALVDLVRTDDVRLTLPLALSVPASSVLVMDLAGLDRGDIGVSMAILAVGVVGALVALRRWALPIGSVAGVFAMASLLYAVPALNDLSTVLMILGGGVLMLGIDRQDLPLFLGGAATTIVGLWIRLGVEHVDWSEAYLAPVAALLVLLGVVLGPSGTSSLYTSGAGVALLGGAGALERIAGGPGEHALLAGALAVVAIVIGAQHRLVGPLVSGTVLIVVVAVHESLAYTASVPTWGWLAMAGTALLGAAVLIERTATSPLTSGRRALEIVRASYR